MNYRDGAETYWMLLTFMALPADRQLSHLPYVPARNQHDLLESNQTNPLLALLLALRTYSWGDELHPTPLALDRFDEAVARFARAENANLFCREEFRHASEWSELRDLARVALAASTMPPHPIPDRIDFNDLIELDT